MKKLLFFFILTLSQLYYSQSDCISAIPICGNSNISYTPSGSGTIPEILNQNSGCLSSNERYSVWYTFTVATTGTLAFTISPNDQGDDYDFAVYGPTVDGCTSLQSNNVFVTPIRCNYSGTAGDTGLDLTLPLPNPPPVAPNYANNGKWSPYMEVTAGQTYYLIITNHSLSSNGFSMTWTGTASLSSAFSDPALTPFPFITPGVPAANPANPNEILKCALPMQFDFTTLTAGILNGNTNFTVTYHNTINDAITGSNPLTVTTINGTTIYYYRLKYTDPANPNNPINGCFQTGSFKFKQGNIVGQNATLTECNTNGFGTGTFNLTAANVFNDPTAIKKYYLTMNDLNAGINEITNPAAYVSSAPKKIYVKITSLEGCSAVAEITLQFLPALPVTNTTISACNNNNIGTGVFDLTSANVYPTTINKKYYTSMADLTAGTNEITNPAAYTSEAPKKIYVKVINAQGCTGSGEITLQFFTTVVVYTTSIESCFIESDITKASFNLTLANVTTQAGVTKKYYTTFANATAETNEISTPAAYIATDGEAFIRVSTANGCYSIARVILRVIPPVKSTVLTDKTICIEDKTTLDAGPGFDGYEWSTGATTPAIQNVGVGSYWVKLKTGNCYTLQEVNVYASNQPVIKTIDITNNTITVTVSGGAAPYLYSTDGITWQQSNVFTGLPRGENKIYVKDSLDCNPVSVQVTVPNLINAITPNGDNVNDEVDYSALAYKKDLIFTVYNRYGNKIYEADKIRNYKWNGTSGGKKIPTGTYWYTITWTEDDRESTQTKYTGWILVKNRD